MFKSQGIKNILKNWNNNNNYYIIITVAKKRQKIVLHMTVLSNLFDTVGRIRINLEAGAAI